MRPVLFICTLMALLASACSISDPYTRLAPAPTPELSATDLTHAYDARWPSQFKCVQTVTLDFGRQSRTLVGYLAVQRPGRFRLKGMTEHGMRLFEIAHNDAGDHVLFAADEFDEKILDNISRDIRRIFLDGPGPGEPEFDASADGTRFRLASRGNLLRGRLVGDPPRLDFAERFGDGSRLYRVDHYDWREFEGAGLLPSVVVLRESGRASSGPSYKLTMQISQLTPRAEPWPDRLFEGPK